MAAFHRILLLFSVSLLSVTSRKSQLSKRGIIELAGTVECSTGKSALDYTMYGCYCGLGGRGKPKDQADWCCFRHDCCYGKAEGLGCQTKTDPYHWTCKDHTPECDDLEEPCKKMLCRCDKVAAECLKNAPYSLNNAVWPNFLCLEEGPSCDDKYAS